MGEAGLQLFTATQTRPSTCAKHPVIEFRGRWADLANFCSDRWFRSRAVVPLHQTGPSYLFRPRVVSPSSLPAHSTALKRSCQVTTALMQGACQKEVVGR